MPQHEHILSPFHTWAAQSQHCCGERARSQPDTEGQAGKSGLFLLLLPFAAHFLRRLPNYFPGRLCPAVPFCSGMEGSLKIRAASNGTEMPRKTTARTSLWTVGSSEWVEAKGLWANLGCFKVSWSVAPAFLG